MDNKNTYYPGVTVGIPFYAGVEIEHLRIAVDSIFSQSLPAQEIHLIQDGSVSKEVEELISIYIQSHKNVKHLMIECNRGLPYALNLSILSTSTNYYARMDADDVSHPDRLKKQVEFLEKNPDVDILGTWALEFEHDYKNETGFLKKVPTESNQIQEWLHYRNPLIHPSVMFRRNVFAKIGLYDANSSTGAKDLQLWIRAVKRQVVIKNLSEPLLYYRCSGAINRRSRLDRVLRQAKVRYQYHTLSPKLNLLKTSAILFRLMPQVIKEWGYKNLRR